MIAGPEDGSLDDPENCPCYVITTDRLSKDAEPSVRMAVAGNATVSSDVLKKLSKDRSKDVRTLAKARLCGQSGNETIQSSERLASAMGWQADMRRAATRWALGVERVGLCAV